MKELSYIAKRYEFSLFILLTAVKILDYNGQNHANKINIIEVALLAIADEVMLLQEVFTDENKSSAAEILQKFLNKAGARSTSDLKLFKYIEIAVLVKKSIIVKQHDIASCRDRCINRLSNYLLLITAAFALVLPTLSCMLGTTTYDLAIMFGSFVGLRLLIACNRFSKIYDPGLVADSGNQNCDYARLFELARKAVQHTSGKFAKGVAALAA